MTTFSLTKIQRLREKASKIAQPTEDCPQGWSISQVDPMAVLAVFNPLRIKRGYTLRAYQFRLYDNANGFVWAVPEDSQFPEPDPFSHSKEPFFEPLKPPKPSDAVDDLMEAVDGDGSPWSYLCASLLCRELNEFGAMWHGCDWSTQTILGENPWAKDSTTKEWSLNMPSGNATDWKWLESEPSEWQPQVNEKGDEVTVEFITFSGLGQQAFYRNTDRFHRGSYSFETEQKEIATGPGGYVF